MDTLEVKEYAGEEGFDECVECGCREVSVIMKSTIVRIALCEHKERCFQPGEPLSRTRYFVCPNPQGRL